MEKEELIIFSSDKYQLALSVYPAKKAKASIMFVHGMEEHQGRYEEFAKYLQGNGYNVITSDLRGHGKNAPKLSHIANKKGHELILEDQRVITRYIKERFKDVPLYIFGHSMGTIITRDLLQKDDKEYAKVALSGYVNPNPASPVAVMLGSIVKAFKGGEKYSKLLTSLAVGPFSKNIKDKKTDLDWLSYNEENVKNYIDDPLSGVEFTIGSYDALFHLLNNMGKANKYKNIDINKPILLIAGEDDPCTGGEKGRKASKKVLEKAGYKNIEVITLKGMRHEILNEKEKEKVYQELLDFFNK